MYAPDHTISHWKTKKLHKRGDTPLPHPPIPLARYARSGSVASLPHIITFSLQTHLLKKPGDATASAGECDSDSDYSISAEPCPSSSDSGDSPIKDTVSSSSQDNNKNEEKKAKCESKTATKCSPRVKVKTSTKCSPRERKWDRKHACLHCQKLTTKMPRHLETHHSNESLVKEALLHPTFSPPRKKIFDEIREKGGLCMRTIVMYWKQGKVKCWCTSVQAQVLMRIQETICHVILAWVFFSKEETFGDTRKNALETMKQQHLETRDIRRKVLLCCLFPLKF